MIFNIFSCFVLKFSRVLDDGMTLFEVLRLFGGVIASVIGGTGGHTEFGERFIA